MLVGHSKKEHDEKVLDVKKIFANSEQFIP